jgi:phenylalanyl-tRNA synthetase beta chain
VHRFTQLLAESAPELTVCDGMIDIRRDVPEPFTLAVPLARVQRQIGVALTREEVAGLLGPIGFATDAGDGPDLAVRVPTNRPDVRPAPFGIDDVIEEVARTFGYSHIPRRTPTWPQPGHLTPLQRSRRLVKGVLCGIGASEAWTNTFVSEEAHRRVGLEGPAVRVSNPLIAEEPFLRRSLMPGLLSALAYNAGRRQGEIRLFEVGVVFSHPDEGSPRVVERSGSGGSQVALLPGERELLGVVLAHDDDDASSAVVAWRVLADAFRLKGVRLDAPAAGFGLLPGLHPTRSARLVAGGRTIGAVGEIDPDVAVGFGLSRARIGWLEVDLGLLFDGTVVGRRAMVAASVSRFPSSDIDLALVVDDAIPADLVADTLGSAAGDLLESVTLFDVYRGPVVGDGRRSLAFRLRFCALDHTLTDDEVGALRARCIDVAIAELGAVLR